MLPESGISPQEFEAMVLSFMEAARAQCEKRWGGRYDSLSARTGAIGDSRSYTVRQVAKEMARDQIMGAQIMGSI